MVMSVLTCFAVELAMANVDDASEVVACYCADSESTFADMARLDAETWTTSSAGAKEDGLLVHHDHGSLTGAGQ